MRPNRPARDPLWDDAGSVLLHLSMADLLRFRMSGCGNSW
jgi:hypothetical protein